MKRLPGAKAMKRQPKEPKCKPEVMNSLPLAKDAILVVYVAKYGVTKEEMYDHYEKVMIPWLKKNYVTEVKCWISRHNRTNSITLLVDAYVGDWRTIRDIHTLYRSDSKKMLMKAELKWDGHI